MEKLAQLKSFEDACRIEGLDHTKVIPDFSCYPEKDRKSMEAHAKIVIVVRAANRLANDGQEWTPDFNNRRQWKYEIWWEKGSSGFRFDGYEGWRTRTNCGSRLCFISSEVAEYVAKQFEALYNEYLL